MSEITPIIRVTVQEFKSSLPWGDDVRGLIESALQAEAFSDGGSYTKDAIETANRVILDVYDEVMFGDESNVHYYSPIFDYMVHLIDGKKWYKFYQG